MISSLFSMFDPSSTPVLGGKWWFAMIPLGVMSWSVFPLCPGLGSIVAAGSKKLLVGSNTGLVIFLLPVFFIIFCWNEVGLIPYSFGVSSHLSINLSMGLVLVSAGVFNSVRVKGWKIVLSHMVPTGAPLALSFGLALVESVSFLIRPFTLSIRLTGNMITGHLLIALLHEVASALIISSQSVGLLSVLLGAGLLMFELVVGLIQAVIFTVLVYMYWTE